jgi:hypothetical protein
MTREFVYVKEVRVSLSRSPLRLKFLLVFTLFRRVRCRIVLIDARTGEKASGRIVGFHFACSEVQTLTPGPPSRMIYRTRKWICHSLASVARGIRLSRLSTCTRPSASFDASSRTAASGALAIRMPLETWVVLRGGCKNTEKCGIRPWETSWEVVVLTNVLDDVFCPGISFLPFWRE